MMNCGWMSGEWSHMSPFMGILMFIFWGLVIYAVIMIVRGAKRNNKDASGSQQHETPLEILKKRYASGEIDHEEYNRIKKDLE